MEATRENYIKLLEERYGQRPNEYSNQFGPYSAKQIADDLYYDAGQFTKLISPSNPNSQEYGTSAYSRAIKRLQQKIDFDKSESGISKAKKQKKLAVVIAGLLSLYLLFCHAFCLFSKSKQERFISKDSIPLLTAFERVFDFELSGIDPYWDRERCEPELCPCMKYQGKWSLNKDSAYQLPIPYDERSGYHYKSGTSALYLWCEQGDSSGHTLEGLEVFENGIYFDINEIPCKTYFSEQEKFLREKYYKIDFEKEEDFVEVAKISSLFYNVFQIRDGRLIRNANRLARYNSKLIDNNLKKFPHEDQEEIEQAVNEITTNYIGNLVTTKCDTLDAPTNLVQGSSLSFPCMFYFGENRYKIPYTKILNFTDQRVR